MPTFTQIKEVTFQVVAVFFAIAITYVFVSDDGINKPVVVLSPELKAGNSSLCIPAKSYDFRAIKLLFCTRDVQVMYSTSGSDLDAGDFDKYAVDPVKMKVLSSEASSTSSFYKAVDSFARIWHFTDGKYTKKNGTEERSYQTKTVHMSPFVSVCFQSCTECYPVTSTLVFNSFFTVVFVACLGLALVLRILAHRCWRILSTSVMSVALPCIIIFLIASRKASATWAGIWALGGWGILVQYGKPYVWNFVHSPVGQAVLVIYIAAIIAANYFLPTPRYDQKSAVAWLGRIVCAAVVLVISPLVLIPSHELQHGIPESCQVTPNIILALSILLLCIVFDSFSLGAVLPDDPQPNDVYGPHPHNNQNRTSAVSFQQPHPANHRPDRAQSPQPQSRDSFLSPQPTSHQPFSDPQVFKMYELYKQNPENWT